LTAPWLRRAFWFVALWVGGVAAVGAVAAVLHLALARV